MNTLTTNDAANAFHIYPETIVKEVYYPSELKDEMGETACHGNLKVLFFGLLRSFYSAQNDVTVAANMMVYYEKGDTKRWLAPDIFVCFGVENELRRTFKTWEEGVFRKSFLKSLRTARLKTISAASGSITRGSALKNIIRSTRDANICRRL